MEFQVYAVHLEDRYPPALPEDYTGRDELMSPGFHDALIADSPSLEKQVDGCVAFVFGRTADGLAFIKAEDGIVQRVEGDAETVLSAFVARAPGIGAYYARNVPHLVQLMRYNSGLLRGREQQPSVEAAPASAKRVAKKQRRK